MIKSRRTKLIKWLSGVSVILLMLGISAVTVSFSFDGSVITKDKEIVVFETLYREETEIAVHADIEDEGQTVTIHPQPEPEKPQTGDNSNLGFYIGLGSVAVGGLIAFLIIKFKKKDEDDE